MTQGGAYVPELDGLRAISILMVMLGHAGYLFIPAALGVTIFFVISGYLICGMLLREMALSGSLDLPAFYTRRFLRLYPELLVYLGVLALICMVLGWDYDRIQLAGGVFYFTNYLQIYGHVQSPISYITRPLWSLAVEEHFYLIFPVFVLALRGHTRTITFTLLLTMVAVGVLRAVIFNLCDAPEDYFDFATESRIDAVCGGCLLACIAQSADFGRFLRLFHDQGLWLLVLGVLLILLAVLFRNGEFRNTWRFSLEALGSTLLLGSTVWGQKLELLRRLLRIRSFVFLGRLSYAAYLYHLLVYALAAKLVPVDTTQFRISAITLSFAAASVSFCLIEIPVRPLRRRFGSNTTRATLPIRSGDTGSVTGAPALHGAADL